MGYDRDEYDRDCTVCGTNYVYRVSYDHDSFNYSYSHEYECPTCGKGLYVEEYKTELDKLKSQLKILIENRENYYSKIINDENELVDKVTSVLKTMPSNRLCKARVQDDKLVEDDRYYYRLISCYKTKFGLKKDTVYQSLVDSNLYDKSITAFKKEYRGKDAIEVFLNFYGLTSEDYSKYLSLNIDSLYRTETYKNQYYNLVERIEKVEKDYEEGLNAYNKYHKKE